MDADKALDGGAVHHDLVVHGLLDLGGGDGDVFKLTKNIGELKADKFYVLFRYDSDDIFLRIFAHSAGSPFQNSTGYK
jgi:hypothetical protein